MRNPLASALVLLSVASAAATLAGCVAPTLPNGQGPEAAANHANQPAGRDCFNVQFLTGYDTVSRNTLRVRVGPNQSYDLDVSGTQCNDVDWTHRLAIESTPSSWICVGTEPGQGNIAFRDPTTRRRVSCYIDAVRRAPAETPQAHH